MCHCDVHLKKNECAAKAIHLDGRPKLDQPLPLVLSPARQAIGRQFLLFLLVLVVMTHTYRQWEGELPLEHTLLTYYTMMKDGNGDDG